VGINGDKIMAKLLKLLTFTFILISCSLMSSRDFEREMDEFRNDDPMLIAGEDFQIASGDSGSTRRDYMTVLNRTPPTKKMREDRKYRKSLKSELAELESQLSDNEFQGYASISESLGDESEKIYFLGLTSDEKRSYLELKGLQAQRKPQSNYRSIASQRPSTYSPVQMGMTMAQVVETIGYPVQKEVAGNPAFQNERWTYDMNGRTSYVYFSGARVEGWE
jgi:hypothetical protein